MIGLSFIRGVRRRAYLDALLIVDRFFGKNSEMIPRLCRWDGKNALELKATGEQFLHYFINMCGAKPDSHVLDVGCGIGRIAVPLTQYLSERGSYDGIDIVPEAVAWCSRKIAAAYPNFHFQRADIVNKDYNPKGAVRAANYSFPYDDATFDLVFLGSVFTHMLPREVEQYLSEITRVLKTGGTSLCTYFLLTPLTLDRIERGESTLQFTHNGEGFKSVNETVPEIAIAFDESYIRSLYAQNRLAITEPLRYGTWSYKISDFEYQDFVVAKKP